MKSDTDLKSLAREIGVDNLKALPRDVSPRHYYRGLKDGRNVVVMLYPEANEAERKELVNFTEIGNKLTENGLRAPQLYHADIEKGWALFEDLGNLSFGDCLRSDMVDSEELYTLATDVLVRMRDIKHVEQLPRYQDTRIYENRRQLVDYYMTFTKEAHPGDKAVQEFLSIWEGIENSLPPCPQGFVHGDYHLENLMYCDCPDDLNQCGLIDFQDAFYGPLPYDLLNLIEDARVDILPRIHQDMMARYCAEMSDEEKEIFRLWFRVLATQFHGRVIGLFIKLAAEQNRDSYLVHIPRLQNYLKKSLQDPVLAPLKAWFDKVGLDLETINDLDGNHIRNIFRNIEF